MIEDQLMNYGILGLWTLVLLGERFTFQNKLSKSLDELTEAIRGKM